MANRSTSAVVVEGRRVVLEVHYKIVGPGVEESDSNIFSDIVGGLGQATETQAKQSVVNAAAAWVSGIRLDNPTWEIHAWDDCGNSY